uniref:Uncharacterized protein n=1 Tax=Arundo donax TaxID=35708 RepID=A0A0A8YXR3_ARUDO
MKMTSSERLRRRKKKTPETRIVEEAFRNDGCGQEKKEMKEVINIMGKGVYNIELDRDNPRGQISSSCSKDLGHRPHKSSKSSDDRSKLPRDPNTLYYEIHRKGAGHMTKQCHDIIKIKQSKEIEPQRVMHAQHTMSYAAPQQSHYPTSSIQSGTLAACISVHAADRPDDPTSRSNATTAAAAE